jgi:uncharacterized protein
VHSMIMPPRSRMDILSDSEVNSLVGKSKLATKYNQVVDSKSAYEILNEKINLAEQRTEEIKQMEQQAKEEKKTAGRQPKETSFLDSPIVRSAGRTAATMLTRSLLGVLGLGGTTRRRSRSLF